MIMIYVFGVTSYKFENLEIIEKNRHTKPKLIYLNPTINY